MADIFTDTTVTNDSPLNTLVGEGRKFKTVDDLAKSKLEADTFIGTLTEENATLRADLATRKTVEDQIIALEAARKVVPIVPPADQRKEPEGKVVTDDDLNQRIKATIEANQKQNALQSNVQLVADTLVKVYGSEEKASEVVKLKAAELKVSVAFLQSTAAQSPQAFYELVGVKADSTVTPVTRSDVNPEAFRTAHSRTQPAPGTYEAMRDSQGRLDAKKLMDPTYLRQAHDAAFKDPDKFFSATAA